MADKTFIFNGVYSFSLVFLVQQSFAGFVLIPLFSHFTQLRRIVSSFVILLQPVALVLIGAAVSAGDIVALLYVSVVILGIGGSSFDLLTRIEGIYT